MAMELTHDDVRAIVKLIDEAQHLSEIEVEYGGFRLRVQRGAASEGGSRLAPTVPARPVPTAKPAPISQVKAARTTEVPPPEGAVAIRAPMLGTFYRSPSPGEKPFVDVGQRVKANDTVCLIEVMKLFNSISAGKDGTVVQILVDNGALVEHDQPLIYVMPDLVDEG
jgi:acetyl-CoA carboxylase biotin carboxyl carrier protein